jgi:hypothetical protein
MAFPSVAATDVGGRLIEHDFAEQFDRRTDALLSTQHVVVVNLNTDASPAVVASASIHPNDAPHATPFRRRSARNLLGHSEKNLNGGADLEGFVAGEIESANRNIGGFCGLSTGIRTR